VPSRDQEQPAGPTPIVRIDVTLRVDRQTEVLHAFPTHALQDRERTDVPTMCSAGLIPRERITAGLIHATPCVECAIACYP